MANMTFKANLLPNTDLGYSLGSSTQNWLLYGRLFTNGNDIYLNTNSSSSNDSGDIVFQYGNGQEKARIWTANEYTTAVGPNYRIYKEDGTSLYSGTLSLANHTHDDRYVTLSTAQTITGAKTFTQPIYFSTGGGNTRAILAYDASNLAYGITYKEGNPDVMTFSASGNANNMTNADLSINGLGNGILSHLGNYIPHTGNTTGTVGGAAKPVYVNAGTITACSSTVGSGVKPIYMSSGTMTASTSTVGSGVKPVFLSSGTITVSNSTVGNTSSPVYLNSGTITEVLHPTSGAWFRGVPLVGSDGVMEVGKYIDLHTTNTTTSDFNNRITSVDYGLQHTNDSGGAISTYTVPIMPQKDSPVAAGWRRVCQIHGFSHYGQFKMYLTGGWSTGAPTCATIEVNIRHTGVIMTLTSCLGTGNVSKVRLVNISGGDYWLDCYIEAISSGTMSKQTCIITGHVTVDNVQNSSAVYSTAVTSAAEITIAVVSGISITSNNYSTYTDGRYVKKSGDTMTGTLTNTASPGFTNSVSAGTWAYLRLNNSSTIWDIATKTDNLSGALQFRGTLGNNGPYISTGGQIYGYGEICSRGLYNSNAQFRAVYGNYGAMLRNDGSNFWILMTNSGDQYGSYNSLRPFRVNCADGTTYMAKGYGAVWNDYAEFRETKDKIEPGRCIREVGDDTLILTTERLQKGCEIVSDTFGFAIGESKKAKTPTAASGRVLAYPYEDKEEYRKHIGD